MDWANSSLPMTEIVGILACLVASAFFSGSETALTSIAETRARHLMESEPGRFGVLSFWLDNKPRILAVLLVGNNLVNILCSVLAYRLAVIFLPDIAEAVSVFGLTIVVLVFAEITPKSLALHFAEQVVVPVLRIVWIVDKILWLVAAPLARIPELILRSSGGIDSGPVVTEGEIEYQIRLGHDRAVFEEKEQGDLLMSAVEFSEITVKEVMVPRTDIIGLDADTLLTEAVDAVTRSGHSRIPVFRDDLDHIIGLLHAKDLLRSLKDGETKDIEKFIEIVRKPLLYAPETQKISELLTRMRRRGQHMAIVVDEFGGTSGLITLEDIIEELVGEIRDEFDTAEAQIQRIDDKSWIVDARVSIHDFKDSTGIELPDTGGYESLGGYVVAAHGNIPGVGTAIENQDVRMRVLDSNARCVERLEVGLVEKKTVEEDE
jgi:magnesium and cobalt exporter, CNNM family